MFKIQGSCDFFFSDKVMIMLGFHWLKRDLSAKTKKGKIEMEHLEPTQLPTSRDRKRNLHFLERLLMLATQSTSMMTEYLKQGLVG